MLQDRVTTQRNTSDSALLALPPELRNRIYRYVLGDRTVHIFLDTSAKWSIAHSVCRLRERDSHAAVTIRRDSTEGYHFSYCDHHLEHGCELQDRHRSSSKRFTSARLYIGLLQTCRQIYHEAALLPFSLNTFSFGYPNSLQGLLYSLSDAQRRAIRSISIVRPSAWRQNRCLNVLSKLEGLKEITIYGHHYQGRDGVRYGIHDWVCGQLEQLPISVANICLTKGRPATHVRYGQALTEYQLKLSREWCRALENRLIGVDWAELGRLLDDSD